MKHTEREYIQAGYDFERGRIQADILRMMQGTSLDSALSAWAKVDKAVRRVGTYETIVFDDEIIHRVIHDMSG